MTTCTPQGTRTSEKGSPRLRIRRLRLQGSSAVRLHRCARAGSARCAATGRCAWYALPPPPQAGPAPHRPTKPHHTAPHTPPCRLLTLYPPACALSSRGELEEVLRLVKPQHFLPVHGEYAFLCAHAQVRPAWLAPRAAWPAAPPVQPAARERDGNWAGALLADWPLLARSARLPPPAA